MVKVPRLTNRVKQTPTPGVRISTRVDPEALGGGASARQVQAGIEGLTGAAKDLIIQETKRADDALFLDGYGKAAQTEIDINNERRKKKGEDSFSLPDEEAKIRTEAHRKISEEAKNDRVRTRLNTVFQKFDLSGQQQVNDYVAREREEYIDNSKRFAVESNRKFAINSGSLEEIGKSIEINKGIIKEVGKDQGKPQEEIDLEVFNQTSQTHIEAVNQLVDSGFHEEAKIYFDEAESEIDKETFNRATFNSVLEKSKQTSILNQKFVKIDNQNKFNDTMEERSLSESLRDLKEGSAIGSYNSQWAKAREKEILSSRGIDTQTQYAYENDIIRGITELEVSYGTTKEEKKNRDFQKKSSQFLRDINEMDIKISEGISKGLLNDADAHRLRKSLYSKKVVVATQKVSEQGQWWNYSMKEATASFDKMLPKSDVSFAVREYFKRVDGKVEKEEERKKIVDDVVQVIRDRNRRFAFDETDKINKQTKTPTKTAPQEFNSFQEAKDAKLKTGTPVMINGKRFEAP